MRLSIGSAALLLAQTALPAAGQTILDWPLLLEARPVPLITGAGAVLGNPGALAFLDLRAQGIVSDLETPEDMGLRAVTLAAAVRVHGDWTVGAAYRHVGLGDMLRTDGPPIGGAALPMEIAEDVFALAVGSRFGALAAGIGARLDTPAEDLGGDDAWTGTLGATFTPTVPVVGLRLAGTLEIDADEARAAVAAELTAPRLMAKRLDLALAYGVQETGPLGLGHAVVLSGVWREMLELQAGAAAQPGTRHSDWVPIFAALLHLGRYELGIVREHLPNDFGAALHYRLSVAF